jgi:anti-sigma factor RsiW
MSCSEFREQASAWLDDELTPEAARQMDLHRLACPDCAALAEELRRADAAFRAQPTPMPDEAYWSGFEQRLLAHLGHEGLPIARRPALRRAFRRWRLPAAAAVALGFCALGGYLATRYLVRPRAAGDSLTVAVPGRAETETGGVSLRDSRGGWDRIPWGGEIPPSGAPLAGKVLSPAEVAVPPRAKGGTPGESGPAPSETTGGRAPDSTAGEMPLMAQELSNSALPVAALDMEMDVIAGTAAVLSRLGTNDRLNLDGFIAARDQAAESSLFIRLNALRRNAPPEAARLLEPFELLMQRLGNLDGENVAQEGPALQKLVRDCDLTERARLVRAQLNR